MLKFSAGYHPGYCGAERLEDNSGPWFAYNDEAVIIIDNFGVSIYQYDLETGKESAYNQEMVLNELAAKFIMNGLELLNSDQFDKFLGAFKSNPKTRAEVY